MGRSIIIGNREYDAVTGLPLSDSDGSGQVSHTSRHALRASSRPDKQPERNKTAVTRKQVQPAHKIHGKAQRSTTLNRAYIKNKPTTHAPTQKVKPIADVAPQSAAVTDIVTEKPVLDTHKQPDSSIVSRHNTRMVDGVRPPKQRSLARFNKNNPDSIAPATAQPNNEPEDKAVATEHPIIKKVSDKQKIRKHEAQRQEQSKNRLTPASVLKQAKLDKALDSAPRHHAKQKKMGFRYRTKLMSFGFGAMALMMLGGYMTYINAPNLSVRIAAAQAGIDASYPNYQPDGYSLNGPVAFNDGEVSMTFVANANKEVSYYVQQSSSDWDSATLLENYVKGQSSGDYNTSQLNGMTIYTYGGNAAWVSGGILYTINGNAQLSPDQIRKIASSLS